jgi:hypothetical protein
VDGGLRFGMLVVADELVLDQRPRVIHGRLAQLKFSPIASTMADDPVGQHPCARR